MSQERPAPLSLMCRAQLGINPAQKFIYRENTCRNIPRTYLTDERKPSSRSFFICPFARVLLCPILEKMRWFGIQCVARWLLCYLSGEGAASDCCVIHQVLHRSPAKTHRGFSLILPLLTVTKNLERRVQGGWEGKTNVVAELRHLAGTGTHLTRALPTEPAATTALHGENFALGIKSLCFWGNSPWISSCQWEPT